MATALGLIVGLFQTATEYLDMKPSAAKALLNPRGVVLWSHRVTIKSRLFQNFVMETQQG